MSNRSHRKSKAPLAMLEMLEERVVPAIAFQFDYSLDTNRFFDTQTKKDLLNYAGLMVSAQFSDTLAAIVPRGGNTWKPTFTNPATGVKATLSNPTLPEGVIRVYVGGRNIDALGLTVPGGSYSWTGSSDWANLIKGRGNPGAVSNTPTDVAPRIASIAFDTSGPSWHFGKTTAGLSESESDFVSVAIHELGHVLGFNSSNPSWNRQIVNGRFTGPATKAENGGISPQLLNDGHFSEGIESDGIEVAMDPNVTRGTRKFMSALDLAVLDDIGWDLSTSDDTIFRADHQLTHLESPGGLSTTDEAIIAGNPIGSVKDVDMYRIWADAGTLITAAVTKTPGRTAFDSYVRLFNAAGSQLAYGDGPVGGTDRLSFRTMRSDYYFIGVSSYGNRAYSATKVNSGPGGTTGSYTLSISMDDSSPSLPSSTTNRRAPRSTAALQSSLMPFELPVITENSPSPTIAIADTPAKVDVVTSSSLSAAPLIGRAPTRAGKLLASDHLDKLFRHMDVFGNSQLRERETISPAPSLAGSPPGSLEQ